MMSNNNLIDVYDNVMIIHLEETSFKKKSLRYFENKYGDYIAIKFDRNSSIYLESNISNIFERRHFQDDMELSFILGRFKESTSRVIKQLPNPNPKGFKIDQFIRVNEIGDLFITPIELIKFNKNMIR